MGVELEATLPLTREAIESVRLDARLYAYDPFLADASADLVDQTIIEPLTLASDRESLVRLNLGGYRLPRMDYYVSVRVYRIIDGLQIFFNDRCFRCLWGKPHHVENPSRECLLAQKPSLSARSYTL